MLSKMSSGKALLVMIVAVVGLTGASPKVPRVKWRRDYLAACKEARESQRPMVVDFGTRECIWCKKLDATTFHDQEVIKQMNEQFIPVKIDAERDPSLAQSMRVQIYPTLVFISHDGKVLGSHEGFVDVEQFNQQLCRTLLRDQRRRRR